MAAAVACHDVVSDLSVDADISARREDSLDRMTDRLRLADRLCVRHVLELWRVVVDVE